MRVVLSKFTHATSTSRASCKSICLTANRRSNNKPTVSKLLVVRIMLSCLRKFALSCRICTACSACFAAHSWSSSWIWVSISRIFASCSAIVACTSSICVCEGVYTYVCTKCIICITYVYMYIRVCMCIWFLKVGQACIVYIYIYVYVYELYVLVKHALFSYIRMYIRTYTSQAPKPLVFYVSKDAHAYQVTFLLHTNTYKHVYDKTHMRSATYMYIHAYIHKIHI